MKTLYTIYTSFAKRVAIIFTLLISIGVTSVWGANVTFQRITSTNELTSGAKYLIVYESGKLILNGSIVSSGATAETKSVTISNNTITCDESYAFTITSSSSSWKITGSNGKSIGHTGSSNSLTTGSYTNTISFSSNNVVIGCNSRTLRCNPNNSSPLFRYYTTGQQAIQLYKQTAPSTFTVTCQSNNSSYGTVSQPSVIKVANNTAISANGNTLTVGTTTVTATPKPQDANYTYAFSNWTGIPVGGKVTADVTVTANFTCTARALTNYRTSCNTSVTLLSIAVNGQTTQYTVGDSFSFDGICTATYSDESTINVIPTVSTPDMSTAGTKTITVSYTENGTTVITDYNITVSAKELTTPLNLRATNITCTEATLSWDEVSNIKNYKLTYTDGVSTKEVTTGSESVTLNNLLSGTTYTWEIQAIGDGTNYTDSEIATGTFTTTSTIWKLVTDESLLSAGDKIIIAATDYNYALSTNQKDANRGHAEIVKLYNTITFDADAQILTLEEGESNGTFAFNTGSGYLYAASSSANQLKTQTNKGANANWSISIDGNCVATIVATGTSTHNVLSYNSGSSLFACYLPTGVQKSISIYKEYCVDNETYKVTSTLTNANAANNNATTVLATAKELTLKYSANAGYLLPETITVQMGGATLVSGTDYTWDKETGELTITATGFYGDIDVKIVAEENPCYGFAMSTVTATSTINSITLTWTEVAEATGYKVRLDEGEFTTATGLTHTFEGLSPKTPYNWEVQAVKDGDGFHCEASKTGSTTTQKESFTITWLANGHEHHSQTNVEGTAIEIPAEPVAATYACDGYLFEGWSTYQQTKEDANCPELVDANTLVENDLELHAVWKKASTSGAGTQIFYESFDTEEGSGANDGKWGNDVGTEKLVNDTWTFANGYGADHCVKLGSSKNRGSAATPALTQLSGDAKLSFKAAAWVNNNETTTLNLSISGGGTLTPTSVTMVKGAWTTYEVQIKDGTPSSTITFAAANAANNRFFLDEVMITTSGSYNYTTSPNCGPTMVAKEGMWVTSANGQSVKVNIPVGVKQFAGAATITGTSTNENFVVNTLENVSNGEHNLVVVYTPTADDTKENTTITLTAKNGEEVWSTTTFTLNGRSLPTEFVVVANRGDKNYALPANMTEANTYPGLEVEVTGNEVSAAPVSHLYTARAVHSTRFTENGTALRLVGNNDACLWASTAKDGTSIRNYANISNATDSQYEWNLYTEDGETYRISCTAVTEEGRILRMYGQKFGMYKSGSDAFRILPVECTSTPLNVSVSAARTSATISWTNADACNVEVYNGSTKVQTISAAASPVVVSNLAESTAYTFTLTPADNESCVASGAFTTTGPTIDIVEWETNGILIQVDKDNELNPKVVIKGEKEHGNVGGNVADELFFSKYFESHGENKLLAIFNGTTATIDLNGYTIKSENGILDLSQFGQTKGKVASNEEIILVYYDANYSAEECAEEQQGYENWNILTEKGVLAFSGRGSLGLYRNDVLIDVIGSTFPSGELTKIGKSDQGCGTGDDVRLHIGGKSVNDQSSFFCYNGDNHKTTEVETDYPISTNRCLLIRKNTVTSGANAVASNKAEADATCGNLSSTFTTLCSEWSGFRIGSGSSSNAEIQNATCDGLGYVGGFDYNNYYRTLETLDNSKTLNECTRNADENTYFIKIENLAQYSCLNIQLQLTDDEGNVLTEQTSQVPILVVGEKSTTDEIFSAIVKDSETSEPDYETSKIRCSTCDVVILEKATLTKAAPDTENDVNQVRDIYIYPGGKLVVPANATDYSVNNISLRRVQDEVAAADIQAPLNITSSLDKPIYADVRINSENWHWFTLPYDCNIADVTWKNGSKAIYNSDWFLMYYDGESRAASTNPHDNHWKVYEGTKIEAGKGYIVGITGDVSKPAVKFELRFPMAQDVLTDEKDDKKVAVNAWGVKSDNKPNNLGWNLVGNPYLNYYKTADEYSPLAGLPLIKYTSSDLVVGEFCEEENGDIPFLVTPIDGGWYEYRQELASEVNMMPFTAYFVQVGDPDNPDHTDGKELNASFEASNRGKKSIVRRAPREVEEIEEPIIVRVELTNSKGESDKTSLVIDDRFTNDYEMNGDFFKWFGDYYNYYTKPVLYTIGADQGKRAFNALNEELAAQPIPMGMYAAQAGNYTFSLNQQFDLSRVEEVWLYDATQSTYTNLMQSDYTFSTSKVNGAGRFSLSVKLAPKVATGMDNVSADKVWATTHTKQVIVNGLENGMHLWLYDATGKLLYNEPTSNYQHTYAVPQTGTYFVSVMNGNQKQTIKVVVE